MAVTRINNNQVTDAITGNTVVGINAGTKLQAFSITATRIANNLTYGSDLTVAGNLTVQGQTTTVDTVNTLIQDPLITLADGQTSGAPTLDIGTIGLRGSQLSAVLGWKESALEFVTALSNTTVSNTTFNINSYANLHTGNLTVQGTTSLVGNIIGAVNATDTITGGNLATAGTASAGGNVTGGNLLTGGLVSATSNITSAANITGGNILTGGQVSATANVTGGNLVSATVTNPTAMTVSTNAGNINLSPAGNIVLNTTYINGLQLTPVQNGDAASKYYVDTIATTGITIHEAVFAATISNLAVATGGTVTYAQPNGVANGIGATLTTTGSYTFIDTANVQTVGTRILVKDQANAVQNGVYVYSNATVITRSTDTDQYGADSAESFSINDYFFTTSGNVNAGTAFVVSAPPGVITFGTSNIQFGVFSQSQVYSANTSAGLILNGTVFSAKVDNNTTAFSGTGNIEVKAGANLTTPNIGAATGTSLSTTGTITGGNLATGGTASVGGNITGANLLTGGLVSATATITGGNLATGGTASATGNITGGNVLTGGLISATGNITGANLILTSGFIDGPAAGRVTINGSDLDTDFAVDGDTLANVFYVDAGTGTASFGNSTQITNAIASFNVTSSMVIPRGNILQRPATGVTGMMRFNSTTNSLEIYNNTDWIGVGSTVFTVITDQQFNGDGVNVAFTLANASTTASTIVSINGVLQIPTSAYSVANVTLTFTEAPAPGDLIDVRALTTTATLTSIQNVSGNASIAVSDTSATITMTGDLTVTGNATVLGTVATDTILNGSTQVQIPDANQDVHFDINGVNEVFLVGQFDSRFMGNVNPQANVTYNLGNTSNRWNTVWSNSLTVGNITNANGNGVGNIGSSSTYFNTVFAKATSAQYADLAEKYTADAEYTPGTVLVFGGTAEVTVNAVAGDTKVAGVVSTNPSYTMNSGLESEHVATVALTGRVPTLVVGPVRKGDLMVAAGLGRAQSSVDPKVGSVIGKALEDFDGSEGTIEVVVGRF